MKTTLYIREPGAALRRKYQRLHVEKDGETLGTYRLRELERVVLIGRVELTSSAREALLDAGVDVVFLSGNGHLSGRMVGPENKNVLLRHHQFIRGSDADFRLQTARTIVCGKIRNARRLLQTYLWRRHDHLEPVIHQLHRDRAQAERAATVETLLGTEGEAAHRYFAALGQLVQPEFTFEQRTRRPPRDPVNSLLSFGYTLLHAELTGAVAAEGMDPYVGILHDLHYGRPSLALDLQEEFRAPLVDRLMLRLINRRILSPAHFETRDEGGVYLNDSGRPLFLRHYHETLESEFRTGESDQPVTFRQLFRRQAHRLRLAVENGTCYEPFAWD